MVPSDSGRGAADALSIARLLPIALARAGGSIDVDELERTLTRDKRFRISGMSGEHQTALLRQVLVNALDILTRSGTAVRSVTKDGAGSRISLTDRGWEQARALGEDSADDSARDSEDVPVSSAVPSSRSGDSASIDLSDARPIVSCQSPSGTTIIGHLRDDAQRFHGRPYVAPASALLDQLYRAEVNGQLTEQGFYSAIMDTDAWGQRGALNVLRLNCGVRIISQIPDVHLPGPWYESRESRRTAPVVSRIGRGGQPGRRLGMTWERLVCEVIAELGGHADWNAIAAAVQKRPEAEVAVGWREEARQALGNHTSPRGRGYFDVADIGSRVVYALTEKGQKLAARRTMDKRAPTLSKFLAKAVAADGETGLTAYEMYALLHLAVELGRPTDASAIYHRLPDGFPDEDRYYMAQQLLERADELKNHGN